MPFNPKWTGMVPVEDTALAVTDTGGPGRPVAGLVPEDSPIGWAENGKSVFVIREEGLTAKALLVDTATGERRAIREFHPADPAGLIGSGNVLVTPDARFWVFYYMRDLSDFYLIDGLR